MKKKPKQVMEKVTKQYVAKGIMPYEINDGHCEDWSNQVAELLGCDIYGRGIQAGPHQVEIWETLFDFAVTNHTFVRINGKFYDAECLDGVEDHMDLPIFKKLHEDIGERQPVWCIDANYDVSPINNSREVTQAMLIEYDERNGTDNSLKYPK